MRNPLPEPTVLADRDCLITFAAIALASDNRVYNHEMGYNATGGGTAYITVKGLMRRTGLDRAAAEQALTHLQAAGVIEPDNDGTAWRTDTAILTADNP